MKKQHFVSLLIALTASGNLSAKEPAATIEPAAKALLEDCITAVGGREAMGKIKTRKTETEIVIAGQGMTMKVSTVQQAPTKVYSKTVIPNIMIMEQVYDGAKAWSKDNMQGVRELKGAELDQVKESAAIFSELTIMDNLLSAKLLEEVEENGKTLQVIKITLKDMPAKTLYFDKTTKLIAKITTKLTTGPKGAMEATIAMSDYQEKDGIKYASKMTTTMMGQQMQINVTEVKHNVEVDEAIFTMPK